MLLAGCGREQVAVYDAPKDRPAPPPAAIPAHGHGAMGGMEEQMPPRPGLKWASLPEGWSSRGPSGMRVANFSVANPTGGQADLAVIPLPGTGGSDVDLVNLWRGQLSLPPISEGELKAHTDEATFAGQPGKLFSIVGSGSSDASAAANQILVAALRKDGFTWFFKLAGDAPTVAANRDALKTFLNGVEFTAPEPASAASPPMAAVAPAAPPSGGGQPQPKWEVPPGWQPQTPGQMVLGRWSVKAEGGASADVTVSVFPGETGGMVPNLNRWRSQVGLKPAPDEELKPLIDNLDVFGGKATLADFAGSSPEGGNPARIVAAVVRRDGSSWFYKLVGAPAAVESHREAFVKFVRTAQYPRGS